MHPEDIGRVIGRQGRTATAVRTVIGAIAGRAAAHRLRGDSADTRADAGRAADGRGDRTGRVGASAGPRDRGELSVAVRTDEPERGLAGTDGHRRRSRALRHLSRPTPAGCWSPSTASPIARQATSARRLPGRPGRPGRATGRSRRVPRPPTHRTVGTARRRRGGHRHRRPAHAEQDVLVLDPDGREVLVPFVRPSCRPSTSPPASCADRRSGAARRRDRRDLRGRADVRIDVVTIFPAFLEPPRLSLPGRAMKAGLVDLRLTICATGPTTSTAASTTRPYGGGAGMVMRPEPWGEALDDVATDDCRVIVPTPAGKLFTQRPPSSGRRPAADLRLRTLRGHRPARARPRRQPLAGRGVSLGDYVLDGGEAATIVMTEAVVRLLPASWATPSP